MVAGPPNLPRDVFSRVAELAQATLSKVGPAGLSGVAVSRVVGGTWADLLYASDEVAANLEDLSVVSGEGPRVEALADGGLVVCDLTEDPERWVAFGRQASRLGVQSMVALPLQIGVVQVGVMSLYSNDVVQLNDHLISQLLESADSMALALLVSSAAEAAPRGDVDSGPWSDTDVGLQHAVIHQATGMVMVQQDGSIGSALLTLRAHAFATGESLLTVAHRVVKRTLRFDPQSPGDTSELGDERP